MAYSLRLFILLAVSLVSTTAFSQSVKPQLVTLEGQFVCSQCWFEADRKTTAYGTDADMECAEECATRNVPPAIAVKQKDNYTLFLIEEGKFKKPGENWLAYIGKQVRVTGRARTVADKQFIKLDELVVTAEQSAIQQQVVGTQPELALKDLFGIEQRLSGYHGKIVVLNFWATWCIPCRKEMPDLVALQNEYAALGVQVVGAGADSINDRQKVLTFIKETGINFPVWLGATTEDMKKFGLGPALPGTAIVGRDGKIIAIKNGVVSIAYLRDHIRKLLNSDMKTIASAKPAKIVASSVPS